MRPRRPTPSRLMLLQHFCKILRRPALGARSSPSSSLTFAGQLRSSYSSGWYLSSASKFRTDWRASARQTGAQIDSSERRTDRPAPSAPLMSLRIGMQLPKVLISKVQCLTSLSPTPPANARGVGAPAGQLGRHFRRARTTNTRQCDPVVI